jgi:hypothetical protein
MLCCVMLCYVILCCVMLCYVVLCCVISSYVMFYCVQSDFIWFNLIWFDLWVTSPQVGPPSAAGPARVGPDRRTGQGGAAGLAPPPGAGVKPQPTHTLNYICDAQPVTPCVALPAGSGVKPTSSHSRLHSWCPLVNTLQIVGVEIVYNSWTLTFENYEHAYAGQIELFYTSKGP